MQNNIHEILSNNILIPVVNINTEQEIHEVYEKLKSQGIRIIEITLRNEFAWEAIKLFKKNYGEEFLVGVGTIINSEQIQNCIELDVDFMVSPGFTESMMEPLKNSGIPFITGVTSPSEIMRGIEAGWKYFKFFPAEINGGVNTLKTYASIFRDIKFCPTGGINQSNYKQYINLDNVVCVGGSWLVD